MVSPSNFTLLYTNEEDGVSQNINIVNNNTYTFANTFGENKSVTLKLVNGNGTIITNQRIITPYNNFNVSFYIDEDETLSSKYFEVLSSSLSPITNDEVSLYVYLKTGELVLHSQKDTNELGIVSFEVIPAQYVYTICNEYNGRIKCLNQVTFDNIQTDYQIIHIPTLEGTTRNVLEFIEWSYEETKTNTTSEMTFLFQDRQTNTDRFCMNVSRHDGTSLNNIGSYCVNGASGGVTQTFSLNEGEYLEYTFLYEIDGVKYILSKERSYFIGQSIEDIKNLGILDLIFLIIFFGAIGTLLLFNSFEVYSIGILSLLLGIVSIQSYVNGDYVNILLWGVLAIKTAFVYFVRGD